MPETKTKFVDPKKSRQKDCAPLPSFQSNPISISFEHDKHISNRFALKCESVDQRHQSLVKSTKITKRLSASENLREYLNTWYSFVWCHCKAKNRESKPLVHSLSFISMLQNAKICLEMLNYWAADYIGCRNICAIKVSNSWVIGITCWNC